MKEIKLTQGLVALVDDEDFERINQFKWYAHKVGNTFYAGRNISIDGKQKCFRMHWDVMNNKGIDHINGDGLNNQRYNLRSCSHQENCMNQRKSKNKSSIYKGVSFFKESGKWMANIKKDGKPIYLGLFTSEIEAARAYNSKAKTIFGEFAAINLIN